MQLNKKRNIAGLLATASCALIGASVNAAPAENNEWEFDTAILYYGETDRVQLMEGVFNARKDFGEEKIFNGKFVVDTLTGASATGAVPQNEVQTFTRPSGNGAYEVAPGQTPLDDTFRDTRIQLSSQWTQPISTDSRLSGGIQISNEYDYFSVVGNGSIASDFNKKNTTVSFGVSYALDTIDPVGGRPIALSSMVIDKGQYPSTEDYRNAFDMTRLTGSDDRTTLDMLFGITQIINRRMLVQLNYSYSASDGYHNDPYKILSVVDDQGITQDLLYESRPETRKKHGIFLQSKYAFDESVLDVSYRFSNDDWDISSHTLDSRFRFELSDNSYIQPHIRYYQQSAAEFFQPFILEDMPLPEFASADYRLGEMTAITLGAKYGITLNNGNELAFRLEYYQQDPKNAGFNEPGVLSELDLYPSVKAIIAQVSYSF